MLSPVTLENGKEQFELFNAAWSGERVQYYYRCSDGEIFSTIGKTLEEARKQCKVWLRNRGKKDKYIYKSKTFLSASYVVGRVREKGAAWCLRKFVVLSTRFVCRLFVYPLKPLLYRLKVRFPNLPSDMIGHLTVEPDLYIKEGILGMRSKHFEIITDFRGT